MVITYEIAMAAGRDAGNRSMHHDGRSCWNEDDWLAACEETARVLECARTRGSETLVLDCA